MLDCTLDQFSWGLLEVSSKNSKSSIRHHATFLFSVQSPVFSSAVSSPLAAFSHWAAQSTGSVCQRVCISPWDKWVARSIAPGHLCLKNSHSAPLLHSRDESPHPLSFQPLGEAANVSLAEKKSKGSFPAWFGWQLWQNNQRPHYGICKQWWSALYGDVMLDD